MGIVPILSREGVTTSSPLSLSSLESVATLENLWFS